MTLRLIPRGQRKERLRQILHQYQDTLYWHIRRITPTHEDAQDALQETFIRAYRHLDSLRNDDALKAWLYRITTREALRVCQQHPTADLNLDPPAEDTPDYDALEQALEQALLLLPPRQRAIFTMRHYEDLSYEAIAQALDTNVKAVTANASYAGDAYQADMGALVGDAYQGDATALVGTWMHQDDDSRDYYQFNADGTGYEWEEPLVSIPGYQPRKKPFHYALSAGRLTIVEAYDDPDVERFAWISADCIRIDDDTYYRQNGSATAEPSYGGSDAYQGDATALVGTWMHQDDDSRDYYQFNADGTGYEWEEPLVSIPGYQPRKKPFHYALSAGRLTIVEAYGDTDVERFAWISADCIRIDDDTYYRQ